MSVDDEDDFAFRTFRSPNVSAPSVEDDMQGTNTAHRRRWGRGGANLRGSSTTARDGIQRERYGMANVTIQTEIKLTVKAIPDDPIEYPGWRFSLKSKILGLQMPTSFLFDFIETIDKEEVSVLIGAETRELYLALDAKLFSVLVEAVSGKSHLKHAQTIELEIPMGKGRGALKVIDKAKM